MQIAIIAGNVTNITNLLTSCTWSGDIKQAARKLEFSFLQDGRDPNIPIVAVDCGYTVVGGDDEGNIVFRGNIYDMEKDEANSVVKITAFDNLKVLNKSKTTKKFTKMFPEDIARAVCSQMGVKVGNIVSTGVEVSFIANSKTGYQAIQGAFYEVSKKTEKVYQLIMRGDELDVIEKGELCGVVADSATNMTDSIYKKSIENLVNTVMIVDEQGNGGNGGEIISDNESVSKYSMFIDIYKQQKDKDTLTEAKALFKKPELDGNITLLGDYRAKTGYSLIIRDSNFNGKFWIKSDSHTFNDGVHIMKLQLEFENLMDKVEVETDKGTAETSNKRERKA